MSDIPAAPEYLEVCSSAAMFSAVSSYAVVYSLAPLFKKFSEMRNEPIVTVKAARHYI